MAMFLIRYGELALKSRPVRQRFQKRLIDNIHAHFVKNGLECRTGSDHGRVYLWADDEEAAADILARTFGIVSFSKVIETTGEHGQICETAAEYSKPLFAKASSPKFAIRARRTGEHEFTSQTLARDVGSAVYYANEDRSPIVDLTNPDIEIFVEVRQNKTYIFSGKTPGPGGMPLGSQGKVLAYIENRRDTVAAWLMMKRGCKCIFTTTDPELLTPLKKWDPSMKTLPFEDGNDKGRMPALAENSPENLTEIACRKRFEGVVLGWGAARIESEAGHYRLPLYYPLLALSDDEIDAILLRIDSA